jgi:hypothetical protein
MNYERGAIVRDGYDAIAGRYLDWSRSIRGDPSRRFLCQLPMFFSSHDADTNRDMLRAAGFTLVIDEIVSMREPEADVSFLWVIARSSAG